LGKSSPCEKKEKGVLGAGWMGKKRRRAQAAMRNRFSCEIGNLFYTSSGKIFSCVPKEEEGKRGEGHIRLLREWASRKKKDSGFGGSVQRGKTGKLAWKIGCGNSGKEKKNLIMTRY